MSQQALQFSKRDSFPPGAISPVLELGAYEALWAEQGMSVKKLAKLFRENTSALPSDLLADNNRAVTMAAAVLDILRGKGVRGFGLRIHRAGEYPHPLRCAQHPLPQCGRGGTKPAGLGG